MIENTSTTVTFYAQFLVSGAAGTGLTITATVYQGSDGTALASAQAATEVGGGVYRYLYSGGIATKDELVCVFNEAAATADQTDVPSLWVVGPVWVENLDAASSTLATATALATTDGNVNDIETAVDAILVDTAVIQPLVSTNLDAKVSLQATAAALSTHDGKMDTLTTNVAALNDPTAAAISDAVWDEAIAGHAVAGSTGATLSTAGGASDPLLNAVPGSYASGTAGAALGTIGTGTVTAVQPVSSDGTTISLVQGDSYLEADGREVSFSSDDWPDLTAASAIVLTIRKRVAKTGLGTTLWATVAHRAAGLVPGAGTQTVEFEPTVANTTAMTTAGTAAGAYDVQATLASGSIVTLVTGTVTVVEEQTRV